MLFITFASQIKSSTEETYKYNLAAVRRIFYVNNTIRQALVTNKGMLT